MIRKIIIMTLMLTSFVCGAEAQNKIDALVEKYSLTGNSTFTSAVERDPATRKVTKVVKVLKVQGHNLSKFRSVFKSESNTGNYNETVDRNIATHLLTVEKPSSIRIYMLKYGVRDGYPTYNDAEITIIVKYLGK